jgi:hydroxymethylglutaryl-CoA lyase
MYSSMLGKNSLKLFDVTLRDGLQSLKKIYSLVEKTDILHNIIVNRFPSAIEVGSIVSPKILPQMEQSIELFHEAQFINIILPRPIDLYMLTPNLKSVNIASDHDITNFSFITSVSNDFQKKNTNKNLTEIKNEIELMMKRVTLIKDSKVKLYISCITDCPIYGRIDNQKIINEILHYYYTYDEISEICLSDTCGTMEFNNFKTIIDELLKRNVDFNKISLHLHNQENKQNVKDIIIYGMKSGIYRFDVSDMPEIGGCTVTLDNPSGNLSYDDVKRCL